MEKQINNNNEQEGSEGFVMELFGKDNLRELRHVNGLTHKAERREFFKGNIKVGDVYLNPETEEPDHGFNYDDATGELTRFEDWKALKDIERKKLEAYLAVKDTKPKIEDRIERVLENFDIEKLSREDDGDYFVDRFITEEGIEVAEYINKKTGIIERCLKIEFGITTAETIYDSETGKLKEIREYGDDGKVESFVDAEALSQIKKNYRKSVAEARKNIADNITPEERERLMTILEIEKEVFVEKLLGKDPDIKQ
ncbi:MAG: hypothetical protein Q8L47_01300 [bacterium]|nr:hypothetical protein [bacterium]